MAIAVEANKHPSHRYNYKIWYLELNEKKDVVGIGTLTKEELVKNLFENYQKHGKSLWRAFPKETGESKPVELYDFISQNMFENTHFGNLPTVDEFQETLDLLQTNLELNPIAC